jgi:hypothetical protein
MLQAGIARFNPKTEEVHHVPATGGDQQSASQQAMVMPNSSHVDGKVWMNSVGIPGVHRMELATLKVLKPSKPFRRPPARHRAQRLLHQG